MIKPVRDNKLRRWVRRVRDKTKRLRRGGLDADNQNQVGLLPKGGWKKRSFQYLHSRLIPNIFKPRGGQEREPEFPSLIDDNIGITWIGHATFLVQMADCNILIDPNWAMWHAIIKRARRPGLRLKDLPPIDLVLISHAHHDHLHMKSLKHVEDDQPAMVPGGVGNLLRRRRFGEVHEMEHWETRYHGDLEITFTPCHHWGARFIHDTHRGFGGFMIRHGDRIVYHCGDSAYFDGFEEIRNRCGEPDVALLPIGAYEAPSGREVHMNPEEALDVFGQLKADRMVPMHYGTFPLGQEPLHEPLERLLAEASARGIEDRVDVLEEGLPKVF